MNNKDLKDLIDYVMKNNSWKKASYLFKSRIQPKYIDFTLDTRDGDIWSVTFRDGKNENHFNIESKKDLKKVYEWLDKGSEE